MTERLFEQDVTCRTFSARVIRCNPLKGKRWQVVLDRTAFYPEGGGQPGDRGTLNDIQVLDTQELGADIVHLTDGPLTEGEEVRGVLDWQHRFDLMQNHTGEHIVTGVIHAATGCNNVGFHMGSETITVDLDVVIEAQELREYELAANRVVWADAPVEVRVYSHEEARGLTYRSKKELPGAVRIVTICSDDPEMPADVCACCGTHVRRTGEVGLIKLISAQKFRGGTRLELLCGRRALAYVADIAEQNHQVSVALSARPLRTARAVQRVKENCEQLSLRLHRMEEEAFARRAAELTGAGNVVLYEHGMDSVSLRKLAVAVMESCGGRCAVFAGDDARGYAYAMGETGGDLGDLVKELNGTLSGRGGGKPFFVQGSLRCTRSELERFWATH